MEVVEATTSRTLNNKESAMPIDPYSPCPGGTGKKVKFCCTDLLQELSEDSRIIST